MKDVAMMEEEFVDSFLNDSCKECLSHYGYPCCDDSEIEDGSECGMLETANEEYEQWVNSH